MVFKPEVSCGGPSAPHRPSTLHPSVPPWLGCKTSRCLRGCLMSCSFFVVLVLYQVHVIYLFLFFFRFVYLGCSFVLFLRDSKIQGELCSVPPPAPRDKRSLVVWLCRNRAPLSQLNGYASFLRRHMLPCYQYTLGCFKKSVFLGDCCLLNASSCYRYRCHCCCCCCLCRCYSF